ncbi:GumC family protein [Paracnuella aquatica]|uniref:GumC family protein n=1 Tax=Paracnuella aquatica TaxID=2268757 RepID=UPI000DEFA8F2|nr:polysaccharide biosynthesis tyrosine autokinase [Paracnuella aquatica]RPD43529.1 polysaccharide biosynthesis tyrosine autokinase [Paracnuella aquatica]
MEDQLQIAQKEPQSLNIKELFFKYIRFLPWFVFSVAFALLGAYLYLRYTTPTYESAGALIIKSEGNGGTGGGSEANDRFSQLFVLDNSINVQNEIELLKSHQLMQRVVDNLQLNFQYFTKGNIREVHHYKDVPFFVEAITLADSGSTKELEFEFNNNDAFKVKDGNASYAFGQPFSVAGSTFRLIRRPGASVGEAYKVIWHPTRQLAKAYAADLLVAPKGTTGILNLTFQNTHPVLAADVLNQLMQEYKVVTIEDKNETKRQTINFIDDRLQVVSRELDSVTGSLLAYQRANNLLDPTTQSSSYLTKIDNYEEQINTQQVQVNVANMIEAYLRDSKNDFNVVPSSLGLSDPTLNTMIAAYNVAQLERKGLLDANVPAANARVQQKTGQIEQLRLNILESITNVKAAYGAAISRLQQNRGTVRAEIQQLPLKEQNLLEIKKQQEMKQSVFNFLMEKREETAISLAATISNIKVVEDASVAKTPVAPNKQTTQLIAIVAGLLLPALVIFAKEALNDKVSSRADIEKASDVPILGEVGHSFSEETLVAKPNSRGMVAEQFRVIRSNLQYILSNMQNPVILVTSTYSGEGKSFISTNLGAVLSLANKRTIILEFDIRKPKILSGLNMQKKPGLTNWLLGKVAMEDLPIPVAGYDNLFVLSCGPVPPNPAEMLLSPQLETLFTWLRANFDIVVMDTAPVGIVSDAQTLSRFADATLYIARQGRTLKKQVGLIDELYHSGKLPHMSVVINDVQLQAGYGYYGYGRYGYTYGYGENSGYFEEETKSGANGNGLFGWLKGKGKKKRSKKHPA